MLVSIVSHFGNMWFLLCLEIPHCHWLTGLLLQKVAAFSSACSFVMSRNPALSLVLLHVVLVSRNPTFSLGEQPSSPEGGSIFIIPAFWLAEWFGEEG